MNFSYFSILLRHTDQWLITISEVDDELIDVSNLKEYFIVSTFNDRTKLIHDAKNFNIDLTSVIVYNFTDVELYDIAKKNGFEGVMPVIVANVLLDNGTNEIIVSLTNLKSCFIQHF